MPKETIRPPETQPPGGKRRLDRMPKLPPRRHGLLSGAVLVFALAVRLPAVGAGEDNLVIFDNDWNTPGLYVAQAAIAPLIETPGVHLLLVACVSGDSWRDEGMANVLSFLEQVGATDIPVAGGAVFPLLNTRQHLLEWEKAYGKTHGMILWKGAWNESTAALPTHPDDPYLVVPPPGGFAKTRPIEEDAVHAMIRLVHAHPHLVTIYEAGPMTNLALAIRLDPAFAGLARQLVFMGGYVSPDDHQPGYRVDDFNILFDPEAAQIVLSSDWRKVTSIADVSDKILLTKAVLARLGEHPGPAVAYLERNSAVGLPLWDEAGAAIVADPALVTRAEDLWMSANAEFGPAYGSIRVRPLAEARPAGAARVTVVEQVDEQRLVEEYISAIQAAGPRK